MDLSASMGYTYRQELTKFDYCICLAAALGYLMIRQQDPVGLVAFDTSIRVSLPPRSKRLHLGSILSVLANLKPTGTTDAAAALHQLAAMVHGKSLVMLFSDLLTDPDPVLAALHHLRHRGHEVIVFHVLDEAEVHFPFTGLVEFEDVETPDRMTLDAQGMERLPPGRGGVPGKVSDGVRQGADRLRADRHQRELRQGVDGISAAAAEAVLKKVFSVQCSVFSKKPDRAGSFLTEH